jgi:ActR/RegA family two-component response regulator
MVELPGVLLLDDDETILRTSTRAWSQRWRVFATSDPTAAVEIARTEKVELALVDLYLPDPVGLDVVARIKQHRADLYTVLVSGALSYEWVHLARLADDVLPKPYSLAEVIRRRDPAMRPFVGHQNRVPTLDVGLYDLVRRALATCDGNKSAACRLLGISRTRLRRALERSAGE